MEGTIAPRSPVLRGLLSIQRYILIASSIVLATTFFVVVVLRYVFEANLFAYEEWVLAIAFFLYFLGGAEGSWEGTHIKADFLSAFIKSEAVRRFFQLLVMIIELGVLLFLSGLSAYMVWENIDQYPKWPATVAWRIPFLVPHLGIMLGFLLMTLYTGIRFYEGVTNPAFLRTSDEGDVA